MEDKIRPWPENTPMVVVGSPETGEGRLWQRVRAPDGAEGYVPAEFLVAG